MTDATTAAKAIQDAKCICGHITYAETPGTMHRRNCPMYDSKINGCRCGGDALDFPHFQPCPIAMRGK